MKNKVTVILEFTSDQEEWRPLPEPYRRLVEKYVGLSPTIFKLPWPASAIPALGSQFTSSDLPDGFNEGVVDRVGYIQSLKGIVVEVRVKTEENASRQFDERYFAHLAEHGFLFDGNIPVAEALEAMGLPTTVKAFKAGK